MLLFNNHIVEKPFYVPSTGKGLRLVFFTEHYDETLINYDLMAHKSINKFKFMTYMDLSREKTNSKKNNLRKSNNFFHDFFA